MLNGGFANDPVTVTLRAGPVFDGAVVGQATRTLSGIATWFDLTWSEGH